MLMEAITFRKALISDLSEIEDLYEGARLFMRETGNPTQWGTRYPSTELIISDIENGELYVAVGEDIEAVFVFTESEDPTYSYIEGRWLNDLPHRAVHRVASRGKVKGMLSRIMDHCFSYCNNIKIDTHRDNTVMQNALSRYGFQSCGIIFLENGEERIAYQMTK